MSICKSQVVVFIPMHYLSVKKDNFSLDSNDLNNKENRKMFTRINGVGNLIIKTNTIIYVVKKANTSWTRTIVSIDKL